MSYSNITMNTDSILSVDVTSPSSYSMDLSSMLSSPHDLYLGSNGLTVTDLLSSSMVKLNGENSGTIKLNGERADIDINGKSLKTWMEAVEQRLAILQPNIELEKEWEQLKQLGDQYRKLEQDIKDKIKIYNILKEE